MLQWLLAKLFGLVKKDYTKDSEDEIRGQYADGNYMYDKDGNQLTLDEALGSIPFDSTNPFQGINDFFGNIGGSVKNFFGLINGFFGGLKNLPQSELFNQSYSWLNQFTGANLTGQQQQMNEFNAEQAAIQRGWQERMSNTSYQRAVADISQAGLNPALVMGGSPGATTPSGASSSGTAMSAQGAAILDMLMQKANLAMQDKMSQRQSATAIKTAQIASDAQVKTAEIQERWQNRGQDFGNLDSLRDYITDIQHNSNEIIRIKNELRETFAKIGLINAEKLAQEASARLSNASAAHTSKMSQVLYDAQWLNNEELSGQHLFNEIKRAFDSGLLTDEQLNAAYDTALKQGVITSSEAGRAEFLQAVREGKAFKGWMYAPLNYALRIIYAWSSVLGINVGLGANTSKVVKP